MKLERKPHRDIVQDELELELAKLMDLPVEAMPRDIPAKITAQFLSVTPQKLCEWRNNKANIQIPFYKISPRTIRYRVSDLVKFKANKMVGYRGWV
jgi:hypothetical protein